MFRLLSIVEFKLQNLSSGTNTHINYYGPHFISDRGYVTDFNSVESSGCRPCFQTNINGPYQNFSGILLEFLPMYSPVFIVQVAINSNNTLYIRSGKGTGGDSNWNNWKQI